MQLLIAQVFGQDVEVGPEGRLVVIGFLFIFGGVFGSFMNVVVYRMPRKMSLSRPGSRCPRCEHPIRWHDNVPVFGWVVLGGRCRDCHAPISARYPLVEALVAVVAGLLAWKEAVPEIALAGGLCGAPLRGRSGVVWFSFRAAGCARSALALIEFDGLIHAKLDRRGPAWPWDWGCRWSGRICCPRAIC